MVEEKKPATEKTVEAKIVPQEQFDSLYKQAVELESRYRKLLDAYNALLELYLSHKQNQIFYVKGSLIAAFLLYSILRYVYDRLPKR